MKEKIIFMSSLVVSSVVLALVVLVWIKFELSGMVYR